MPFQPRFQPLVLHAAPGERSATNPGAPGIQLNGDQREAAIVYPGTGRPGTARDLVFMSGQGKFGRYLKRAGRFTETVRTREFWTLVKNERNKWVLTSIEQGAEGAHVLDEQIVATPWSDDQALTDEALIEGAVNDAVPENVPIADVADLDFAGDARAAALDLSLADGRFAPDVLEITARRAAAAWAQAVDGDNARLLSVAHGDVVRELLHPGDASGRTRLVVRGPQVRSIRILALDAAAQPPTMTIEVTLHGRRYIEDRDTTAILAGSQSRAITFTERWTFALDGDERQPWLLAAVGSAVEQA